MNYYRVAMWAVGERTRTLQADVELWAESAAEARQKVFDDNWDARS